MSAQDFNELFAELDFKRVLRDVADEIIEKCELQRSEAFDAVAWAVGNEHVLLPIYCVWRAEQADTWPRIKAMLHRQVLRYLADVARVSPGGEPGDSPGDPADHGDQRIDARADRGDEAGAHPT